MLAGRSGSGKSTTALASLLNHGWRFVADDYCVVRNGTNRPIVHSLYCSAKIDGTMSAAFADLCCGAYSVDGTRDPEEKLVLNLHRSASERLLKELPLRAILLPRILRGNNRGVSGQRFKRVGSGAAVRALAPSTRSKAARSSPAMGACWRARSTNGTAGSMRPTLTREPAFGQGLGARRWG